MSAELLQDINGWAARILALLIDPFVQIFIRGSLFWWPYLLSALLVAFGTYWIRQGAGLGTLGEFRRRFFSRRIWGHPSSQADYAFYIVNSVLYPLIVAPLIVSGGMIGLWTERALDHGFGPLPHPALGVTAMRVAYTLLFFFAYDFGRFLAHGLLHDVPLLWQFHKVHHSAEVLTPLTNFRAHPVELLIVEAVPNLFSGIVTGFCWFLAAGEIGVYSFLGAHVLMLGFNAVANLRHFEVWISFGPALNRWLISPAHHRIHHSSEPRHFGKNRGFELAVWDRMFGTLYVPVAEEEFRLGLGDGTDGAWHSVGRMYGWPCRYALSLLGYGRAPRLAGRAPPVGLKIQPPTRIV